MKDKIKLKMVGFWIEDHPSNVNKIPKKLKSKVSEEEKNNLLIEIVDLDIAGLEGYKRDLESHIIKKKGVSYKREIIIVIVTIIVTAIISNIDRIIKFLFH